MTDVVGPLSLDGHFREGFRREAERAPHAYYGTGSVRSGPYNLRRAVCVTRSSGPHLGHAFERTLIGHRCVRCSKFYLSLLRM
jgi:hypothetical protein